MLIVLQYVTFSSPVHFNKQCLTCIFKIGFLAYVRIPFIVGLPQLALSNTQITMATLAIVNSIVKKSDFYNLRFLNIRTTNLNIF